MAKKMEIAALIPEKKDAQGKVVSPQLGPVTVEVEFGENAVESGKMFGDEAVNSNAFANWRVTLQANIRGGLKRGEAPEAIKARLAGAKMGVAVTGAKVDSEQAYIAKFMTATPEERKAMIAKLRQMAGA
jgi:hypothetical protein